MSRASRSRRRSSNMDPSSSSASWRKISPALQSFVDCQAADLHLDPTDLEERLVGRRRDGRRLDQPATATRAPELNSFTYRDDPDGLMCPLGAHIRRAHPRDALGFGMLLSARHRIIRRGNTYCADARAPVDGRTG